MGLLGRTGLANTPLTETDCPELKNTEEGLNETLPLIDGILSTILIVPEPAVQVSVNKGREGEVKIVPGVHEFVL